MKQGLFRMRAVGLGVAVAALAAVPAQAATIPTAVNWSSLSSSVDTSSCSNPEFSQPFSSWKDRNEYTLAPGQTAGDFNGAGWTLTGGARIVATTLADGSRSEVLDVPSGGTAVSPPMCVTNAYPTARAMVRDVVGGAGVQTDVVYTNNGAWGTPIVTGAIHGPGSSWGASPIINIHPGKSAGWQEARFAFVGSGTGNDTQVYDFYVDPRLRF
jgi:hypothetical protein